MRARADTKKGVTIISDEFSFPALATSALTQAFAFLYGRLAAVLDRRSSQDKKEQEANEPRVISINLESLEVDKSTLTKERIELLSTLDDTLGVYQDNPDLISPENARLLRVLARLRAELEVVYGRHFTFEGEDRPASGVVVEQRIDNVSGDMVGVEADSIQGNAQARVTQVSKKLEDGSTIIGAKIKRIG